MAWINNLDSHLNTTTSQRVSLTEAEIAATLSGLSEEMIVGTWKTKNIYAVPGKENLVVLQSKDEITAWDGARRDGMEGKAALSNQTTSIVFDYLNRQWILTHFQQQLSPTALLAEKCDMIPLEVIYRYAATWSYLKRNKEAKEGEIFQTPVYELCYKRDVLDMDGNKISDPFITLDEEGNPVMLPNNKISLEHPKTGKQFMYDQVLHSLLDEDKYLTENEILEDNAMMLSYASQIKTLTSKSFDSIQKLYGLEGLYLVDGKIEFGVDTKGVLRLADVFDADSARVWVKPHHTEEEGKNYVIKGDTLDKQWYRDGESTDQTTRKYQRLLEHLESAMQLVNASERV